MKKFLPLLEVLAICAALVLLALMPSVLSSPAGPDDPDELLQPSGPPQSTVPTEPDEQAGPSEPSEPSEPADSTEPTEPTDPVKPSQPTAPEEMTALLAEAGYELSDIGGSQLIIVKSTGNEAEICAYDLNEDLVWSKLAPTASGFVGRNGVSRDKREGDKKSPAGLFPLPSAFGNQPDPGCKLPYRQSTKNSYWVDDPNSRFYNQWVEDDGNRDWKSAEHISAVGRAYNYAAVIGYNLDPIVPGAGSAIFLHIGSSPTAGCVALPEDRLMEILLWLDPEKSPEILIY